MQINTLKPSSFNLESGFVPLHTQEFLENQRVAGKVAAGAIKFLENLVNKKTELSLIEMDNLVEEYILDNKCTPTFKNYKGHNKYPFPASCCFSVNRQLVHGIPTDYRLKDGDLISFDLGATYKEAIADNAATFVYGEFLKPEHRKLLEAGKEALNRGIEAAKAGNRVGAIGHAIWRSAKGNGFNVIQEYGGHGISIDNDGVGIAHSQPFVFNKSEPNIGMIMTANQSIAIEPLLTSGSAKTRVENDGWTVSCSDGALSVHFEKTIYIHENETEIITKWDE